MGLITKIFGTYSDRELKQIYPIVDKIEALEPEYKALTDQQLTAKTAEFKERLGKGETLDDILPEAFAAVREASVRVLGLRPYRVQLVGGIVLHQGRIAEMKTGEGKTLVATLPAYLNALTGQGVHIVTVNDYLAKRDSEWMGKVYRFLGLSVGLIIHDMDKAARQKAYAADITYGTNNEMGFDYLRDNMALFSSELVQRGHAFAIVDEVDSILIDEARTPLIISGIGQKSTEMYSRTEALVARFRKIGQHMLAFGGLLEHERAHGQVKDQILALAPVALAAHATLPVLRLVVAHNAEVIQAQKARIGAQDDAAAVAAVAADAQGRFELSAEAAGDYRLQITMVGYNPETQPVTLRTAATDAGTIRLRQGVDIDQVTVTIQKPLVTADAEKTTYSVEDDPQAASSTLEEILRKVPQLTIDAEGNYTFTLADNADVNALNAGELLKLTGYDLAVRDDRHADDMVTSQKLDLYIHGTNDRPYFTVDGVVSNEITADGLVENGNTVISGQLVADDPDAEHDPGDLSFSIEHDGKLVQVVEGKYGVLELNQDCLLYTSPSPRD